jgi:hypothetical protein
MKTYKPYLSLTQNDRGIWDFDTTKGCASGMALDPKGCYSDCYAARSAKIYGYDFWVSVDRHFRNESHRVKIVNQIKKIDMPFIRIGCSGDPSENWQHMINVIKQLTTETQLSLFDYRFSRQIVVITRHWKQLTEAQLHQLAEFNLTINTSVSALDSSELITRSLNEYERLKPFCKSVLRIISCDFNTDNENGRRRLRMQEQLFKYDKVIDTVFRPTKKSPYIESGLINYKMGNFLGKKALISKYNKKTYLGKCSTCKEMCGVTI